MYLTEGQLKLLVTLVTDGEQCDNASQSQYKLPIIHC